MPARDKIREYQRRIARLDATHGQARARLAVAQQKRSEALAAQDGLVSKAERAVDDAVVAMVTEVGPELAAKLLGLEVSQVRRLAKRQKSLNPSKATAP